MKIVFLRAKPFLSTTLVLGLTSCFLPEQVQSLVAPRIRPQEALTRSIQMASSSVDHSDSKEPHHVIIAGAGIMGTATAYYLAVNHGISSTLVDPVGIAPAASGKAGGFLARDWNDGSPTGQLTRRSFDLHQELADTFGAESIQYRRLTCASVAVDPYDKNRRPSGKKLNGIEWAQASSNDASVLGVRSLGTTDTIAQVHPKMLCNRLWQAVLEAGASSKLVVGKVVGPVHDPSTKKLTGARLQDGTVVAGKALLYACGPWTANIMMGIKYHSAVIPTQEVLSQCVFFSGCGDPEVYVRPDKTAYCTGYPEPATRVTEEPGQEKVRSDKIATIVEAVRDASSSHEDGGALHQDPVLEQACYLPATDDGVPLIGALSESIAGGKDCYIATGHTCWGILLGPATGESMASLIATGQASSHVDLRPFQPTRYPNLKPVAFALNQSN